MKPKKSQGPSRTGERGSSLIEVLIALFIMLILTLGILQMFSYAYMSNMGSAARTQLIFKCQQVTEILRLYAGITRTNPTIPVPISSGIVLADGDYQLPYNGGESNWAFWGPDGANIMESPNGPYVLQYNITTEPADPSCIDPTKCYGFYLVTVEALPVDDSAGPGVRRYIGAGIKNKRVTYVDRIPIPLP